VLHHITAQNSAPLRPVRLPGAQPPQPISLGNRLGDPAQPQGIRPTENGEEANHGKADDRRFSLNGGRSALQTSGIGIATGVVGCAAPRGHPG